MELMINAITISTWKQNLIASLNLCENSIEYLISHKNEMFINNSSFQGIKWSIFFKFSHFRRQ